LPIAAAHEATIQQIILAWHLQGSGQSVPIPGTTSLEHLRANLQAEFIVLGDAEMQALDDIVPA
jgi:aryl-alcohol dehydrogenase-like predicted oxidoreductase